MVAPNEGGDPGDIHSNVRIYGGLFEAGRQTSFEIESPRGLWFHVVGGEAQFDGVPVSQGDGVAVDGPKRVPILAETRAEMLAIEMGPG